MSTQSQSMRSRHSNRSAPLLARRSGCDNWKHRRSAGVAVTSAGRLADHL